MKTQHEIELFIASTERAYDLQTEELGKCDTALLVLILAGGVSQTVEVIAWATDDTITAPAKIVLNAFNAIVRGPQWRAIQWVSEFCNSEAVLSAIVQRWVLLDAIARELYRRAPDAVGKAMLDLSNADLLRALEIDALRDFDSFKQSEPKKSQHLDLRYTALATALNEIRAMSAKSGPQLGPIRLPSAKVLEMPIQLCGMRWQDWPRMQAAIVNHVAGFLDIIFWGDLAHMPKTVRDRYREQIRTRKRRNKLFARQEDFPKKVADRWRAEWDFSASAAANRADEIRCETMADIPSPENSLLYRENGRDAYEYVISRYGDDGRRYLDALIATQGNVSAASEAAGRSRVTGTNWRRELQLHILRKNLSR
jgi:hypothetical protein